MIFQIVHKNPIKILTSVRKELFVEIQIYTTEEINLYVTRWVKINSVTSMLVTDVGDQMCWWQDSNVGDKSRHQYRELGINIKYQSPTSHSGVLWCWWPMLVPQDLFKDGKKFIEFATRLNFMSPT